MMFSLLNRLPATASKDNKVFAAISDLCGKQVVSVVSEAQRYCFKTVDGVINTVDMDFINDMVGV